MSPVSEDGYYYAAQHDGQMVEWEQVGLVHLDVDVNVADKLEWGCERYGAEHEKENVAGEERVAKELDGL